MRQAVLEISTGGREFTVPLAAVSLDSGALPTISVIVVNYRSTDHTLVCLRALTGELDYPAEKLQLICVDNASGDGGADRIAREAPNVELVRSSTNSGFAGGCNAGVERATGDVLAFLNNDARPHAGWARAAVRVLRAEPTVAAVASKVLDWDGRRIDFVDGGLTWFGMGYSRHAGQPDDSSHDIPRDVLFATGSSMFIRADVYRELGGFDERFFMFYEDVDLGWRLNLRGWRVRFAPDSIAYHRHHASIDHVDGSDRARELYLLERNALAALYKNFSDETLAKVLPAAMALTIRRATARGEIDPTQLEITTESGNEQSTVDIPRTVLAGVLAIDRFVEMLPSLQDAREVEQAARTRSDADLLPLMRKAIEPAYPLPSYLAAHEILLRAFGIDAVFGRPRKILVITGDAITERMAGPAIRAWHTADVLSAEHDVRLVTVNPLCAAPDSKFDVQASTRRQLASHADWADLVVLQGHTLELVPSLKKSDSTKIVVCDVYDPMHLELLEQGKDDPDTKRAKDVVGVTKVLNEQLRRGDFFLCASERQRHFWLGHLAALGRITPELYDADPSMRQIMACAPFGLPAASPRRTGPGIRGVVDGIGETDRIVLWAGGVYSWFDPLTLIRAIGRLSGSRPDLRLVFLGMRHPNPEVPDMGIGSRTRQLADSLGLTGKHVFFNEGWVPYGERQNWLLDADCGVTTHFQHVETEFSFRTRVLDYLWSGLPIVTTDGDSFADLVRAEKLGVVVPPEDVEALADALDRVLYHPDFAARCVDRIGMVRDQFTWEQTLEPLVRFCRDPRPAADRLPGTGPLSTEPQRSGTQRLLGDLRLIKEYLSDGGPREVFRRAAGRMRRIVSGFFGHGKGSPDGR